MTNAIVEISPSQALQMQIDGACLLDVREPDEHALGMACNAIAAPQQKLEKAPKDYCPSLQSDILLICGSGRRSLNAANVLTAQGYSRVFSIQGGMTRWQSERLPMQGMTESSDFMERYSRQLRLPQVGLTGQRKLQHAKVLLVGAGGLGSPAAFYLTAAGLGSLRLVDDDVVDRSNLQRQILHTDDRVGQAKVDSAQQTLQALNPNTRLETFRCRIDPDNVESMLLGADVVIDGSDNFPTRYLLSDACVQLGIPLVYGAVHQFEGQVSVFDAGRQRGHAPCYRCLFPDAPMAGEAPNCAEAGVLGVLPGIIGVLQATEAIKLILGVGESLVGRLLHVDALSMSFRQTRIRPDPDCRVCAPDRVFAGYERVAAICN